MPRAPVSLLLEPALAPAARLLWLALRLCKEEQEPGITSLAAGTSLTRATVRKQLAHLKTAGYYSPGRVSSAAGTAPQVEIPAELLPEPGLRPQAKLLYGLLQTLPTYRPEQESGHFTTLTLSQACRIGEVTARQAIREMEDRGWIALKQVNRRAPIRFTLRNPVRERSQSEVFHVMERLKEADFRGEAIMQACLSLLIASDEFEENARPGFLINPLTDERMELDRYYYSLSLAFEFNGLQHRRTTKRFPNEHSLSMQKARDLMKDSLCRSRGIHLIVLTRADLSLKTIQERTGSRAPLRDLSRHGDLVAALEKVCRAYRR